MPASFAYTGLQAGKLRHRVRIEQLSPVLDSSDNPTQDPATGEVATAWQLVASVWAMINPVQGFERYSAQQMQSEVDTVITVRFRTGLDATMRAVHNGIIYDIQSIIYDDDSGREWIQLACKSGVSAG